MYFRNPTISHKHGDGVDLPLLIPSFSSKGFGFFTKGQGKSKQYFSETTNALESLGPYLHESFLLSVFDLYHHHFYKPENYFNDTSLVFLDSGGYELTSEFDSTEPKMTPVRDLPFLVDNHEQYLDELYKKFKDNPIVITNFDWETKQCSFEQQILAARKLFNRYPNWLHNFLIKPNSKKRSVINVDELIPHMKNLRDFHVIGFTEKELGKSIIDRLKRVARLRVELFRHEINAPIHIWGGLDPVITPLYFFAGADIFDGVSWLRYLYHNGLAVNRDCYGIVEGTLNTPHDHSVILALNKNLIFLQGLATSLRAFANNSEPDFNVFDYNRDLFEKAYRTLKTKVKDLQEFR